MLLEQIKSPADLKALDTEKLPALAREIRERIIEVVGKNGGHLASNLGTVELTIAMHRIFDSPREPFFFDVGHQSYAHKLITGRGDAFESLRCFGGLSGFPSPEESSHDPAFAGHSGSALSLALGVAAVHDSAKNSDKVVAVIGDASLNNGVTLEALNSTCHGGKNLIIILNDNRMSISPGVGALRRSLNKIISGSNYNRIRSGVDHLLGKNSGVRDWLRRCKGALKRMILPPGAWFEELGIRYFGPIDGHSVEDLENIFSRVRELEGPLLIHVVTEKGHGCEFARTNPTGYHGVRGYSIPDGRVPESAPGLSSVFGEALCELAERHKEVVAVSAAMLSGTGLSEFCRRFPERCYDVGIAEEHAATFSAGLALAGRRPVCALYATFMQRALDCLLHDVVLGNLPVIFALDRAGVVADGPTHHGIYDTGFLRALPHLTIMSPAGSVELKEMLNYAYELNRPVVLRYPGHLSIKTSLPSSPLEIGKAQLICEGDADAPIIWALGSEVATALEVAQMWKEKIGKRCGVVNARFLKPFDVELARKFAGRPVISIEDGTGCGGLFSALSEVAAANGNSKIIPFCWRDEVLPHGDIDVLRANYGLSASDIFCRMESSLVKSS